MRACHLFMRWSPAFLMVVAAVATPATSLAIVGGTTDPIDLAVVLLLAYGPGKDPFAGDQPVKSCTATVVSPHVLVTAAHCIGGDFPNRGAGYTYWVYGGTSVTADPSPKLLEVTSATFDPDYTKGSHDIGVAILAKPIAGISPVAIHRGAIDDTFTGKVVRVVGYGSTDDSTTQTGSGTRRQTTTSIKAVLDETLDYPGGASQVCSGDSGGPNLMTIGGVEAIVAITSAGHDAQCKTGFVSMRMDLLAPFVDAFIAKNDPGSLPTDAGASAPDGGAPAPPPDAGPSSRDAGDPPPNDASSPTASGCSLARTPGRRPSSFAPNAARSACSGPAALAALAALLVVLRRSRRRSSTPR